MKIFENRKEAGRELAKALMDYADRSDVFLYALPRGGVTVAKEVAEELKLPLDVIITRKIGAPYNEEYAIGALAETGETVWNEAERMATDKKALDKIVRHETGEASRRVKVYRQGRELPSFEDKTVIIVDDGIATGLTMLAGIEVARHMKASKIVVAVPHGAKESIDAIRRQGIEVVALEEPEWYDAVGAFYKDFPQVTDQEVLEMLKI
ncbi:MAG: phosphoribosyltransferase family protein [Patescibacteria group bacterium]